MFLTVQQILCVPLDKTLFPNAPSWVPKISTNHSVLPCEAIVGYLAVYRVCLAVAGFFLLLSGIMICVRNSKDPRAYIQNGFWIFKWIFAIGLVVGFFFIPDGANLYFSRGEREMNIGVGGDPCEVLAFI